MIQLWKFRIWLILFDRVPISSFFGQKNCRRKRSSSRKRTARGAIRDASSFVPQLDDKLDYVIGENLLDRRLYNDGNGNKMISEIKVKSLTFLLSIFKLCTFQSQEQVFIFSVLFSWASLFIYCPYFQSHQYVYHSYKNQHFEQKLLKVDKMNRN